MPDIDVDFCAIKREEVINYVREKYGSDHVGQIITYGTMAAKACIKDVARVLKIPFDEANRATSLFPDELNISIEGALEKSKELREYAQSGPIQKKLFSTAMALEGNVRHTGVHAAGIVISPEPLEQIIPLATVAAKTGDRGSDRVIVAQYDMNAMTEVGLVKMDFLGLRNLTIIADTLKLIERHTGQKIDISTIPLDDEKSYQMLQRGDVAGVFQVESSGMREFVLKTKPVRFEDLIALIALFRPGPLQSGMAESYINRKNGKERVVYPHRDIESVLSDTYGVIVYQEQVMLISRVIGGFTPGESDALRKAMGKKIAEKMEEMRVKFVNGAVGGGYDKKFAEEIYDQMAEFAKYGFNKSHSAAYAMIVYQTAYLKANYPTYYMSSVLNSERDRIEDLVPYINACRSMGIRVLGPDINSSELYFSPIEEGSIRFGLSAIKNVGEQAVHSILNARATLDGFHSFFKFVENVDLRLCNRRTIESLIQAGSFHSLGYTRKALFESLDMAIPHGQKHQEDRNRGQTSLFSMMTTGPLAEAVPKGESVSEWNEMELLTKEKEVLGFYFSGHPLQKFENTLKRIRSVPIAGLKEKKNQEKVEIAGVIGDFTFKTTKSNREMCSLQIEDLTGTISGVIFSSNLQKTREFLIKDRPVLIGGTLEKREETGTAQILVDSIRLMDREMLEEKLERSLHLKLNPSALDNSTMAQLQTILKCHSGPVTVYFHISNGEKREQRVIKAHESFGVQYDRELIEKLRSAKLVSGVYLTVGHQVKDLLKTSASAAS
jgi:DNA polymerase-3 subunit alpha